MFTCDAADSTSVSTENYSLDRREAIERSSIICVTQVCRLVRQSLGDISWPQAEPDKARGTIGICRLQSNILFPLEIQAGEAR